MLFLFVGSQLCAQASFRHRLTAMPLSSASILVSIFTILTGFTYRGLSPHKFTPMPGVHNALHLTAIPLALHSGR